MKLDRSGRWRLGGLAGLLLVVLGIAPAHVVAATKYAAPDGSSGNSGDRASDPWDVDSCFSKLEPGDTCIYRAANYGAKDFEPKSSGVSGKRITHRCESLHKCIFDRILLEDVSYLDIVNLASDSNYYDSKKSYTNPRMILYNAHHLKIDSIFVRGEPEQCAAGNPGPGCNGSSEYKRYNDMVQIGKSHDRGKSSSNIEITGKSKFIDANHAVMQFHDDGDSNHCEPSESNFWVHGTKSDPIIFRNKYHHLVEFKGGCNVLIEYADFQAAGNGRGDLQQPVNAYDVQAGGIIHGATMRNVIVRYSNFSKGGSGTADHKNGSHIEIGQYGYEVDGACFPHNSHYRPWGPVATIGRINKIERVQNASILNNAVSEAWYLAQQNPKIATSPYRGHVISRVGSATAVDVDLDGIVADDASASKGLMYERDGGTLGFSGKEVESDGVRLGRSIRSTRNIGYRNASGRDFRPSSNSPLVGSAVPIATTLSSGSSSTIPVNRPQCFAGSLGGMRPGDIVDVEGSRCVVTSTDIGKGTITCSKSLDWNEGDSIYYVSGGQLMRDIGSRMPNDPGPNSSGEDESPPKPPVFE